MSLDCATGLWKLEMCFKFVKIDWPNVNDIMSSWAEGALDIFKTHSPFPS